jgi:hypothetical protein
MVYSVKRDQRLCQRRQQAYLGMLAIATKFVGLPAAILLAPQTERPSGEN